METPDTPEPRASDSSRQPPAEGLEADRRVPLFGTWRAIHGAVIACALLVMGLLALFSRWPF